MLTEPMGLHEEKLGRTSPVFRDREFPIDLISSEYSRSLVARVEQTVEKMGPLEPTALPLVKLHIFNTLTRNPDISQKEWEREIRTVYDWSHDESLAADQNNPLPTVGIEIESPENHFGSAMEEVFDAFGIRHYVDIIGDQRRDEVAPHFTYDAKTSARLIHELTGIGAFPLEDNNGVQSVPDDVMLGLHVNLGLPDGINREMIYGTDFEYEMERISDLLGIAFASPERIRNRNQHMNPYAVEIKSARESRKVPKVEENENYWGDNPEENTGLHRLEFRAMEMRSSSVYRMLVEVQRLMAAFFASVKTKNMLPIKDIDNQLSQAWAGFHDEASELLQNYSERFRGTRVVDYHLHEVAEMMEQTDIQSACRGLVTQHARKIALLLESAV